MQHTDTCGPSAAHFRTSSSTVGPRAANSALRQEVAFSQQKNCCQLLVHSKNVASCWSLYAGHILHGVVQGVQGIYCRECRVDTAGSVGYILQGVKGIYCRKCRVYTAGSAGYILQGVQGIYHMECKVYTAGSAGCILQGAVQGVQGTYCKE